MNDLIDVSYESTDHFFYPVNLSQNFIIRLFIWIKYLIEDNHEIFQPTSSFLPSMFTITKKTVTYIHEFDSILLLSIRKRLQ